MESRKGWGVVIGAGIFAVLAIGVALGTYFFEDSKKIAGLEAGGPNDVDRDGLTTAEELAWGTDPHNPDSDGDGIADGAEVDLLASPTIAGSSVNPFETKAEAPETIITSGIAKAQLSINAGASDAEVKEVIANLADEVGFPDLEERIAVSDLNVKEGMSIKLYSEILYEILRESVTVRQSELAMFRKTIGARNYSGTPGLKDAARTYKEIEAALIAMQVPPEVSVEHTELVNAVGTLANIVAAMASWSGDSFAGIAYIEAFTATQQRLEGSITTLGDKVSSNLNKP